MKKVGQFLKCLLPMLILLFVQILASGVVTTFTVFMFIVTTGTTDVSIAMEYAMGLLSDTNFVLYILLIYEAVSFIIFALIYFVGLKRKFNTISGHFTLKTVPIILVFFTALELIISCLLILVENIAPDIMTDYANLIESSGLADLSVLSTILTLVCAPIVEELAMRGVTMTWAMKLFNNKFWLANILQALLFGILHMNLVQGIYAFVLGLLLGYVCNKYKSLWASIIAHLTFNFAGTYITSLLFGTSDIIPTSKLVFTAVGSVVVLAGFTYLLMEDKTYEEA